MMRRSLPVVFLVACVLLVSGGARAQVGDLWSLTLTDPDQTAPPGGTMVYNGVLANHAGVDLPGLFYVTVFMDHLDGFWFDPGFMALFDAGGALPAAGYTGPLFHMTWSSAAPPGYSFVGQFGASASLPNEQPESHSMEYIARVAPVPEPSTAVAGAASLVAGLSFLLRRRRA